MLCKHINIQKEEPTRNKSDKNILTGNKKKHISLLCCYSRNNTQHFIRIQRRLHYTIICLMVCMDDCVVLLYRIYFYLQLKKIQPPVSLLLRKPVVRKYCKLSFYFSIQQTNISKTQKHLWVHNLLNVHNKHSTTPMNQQRICLAFVRNNRFNLPKLIWKEKYFD